MSFDGVKGCGLLGTSRRDSYGIILGIWGMVALYAVLHDQYLVRIAPEHFTVYHYPIGDIQNPHLLAAVYGIKSKLT